MKEAVINGIFPTPIYMSKLDRALSPLELKFVDKNKKDFYKRRYINLFVWREYRLVFWHHFGIVTRQIRFYKNDRFNH
jgi:hypothetical protein